LGDRLVGGCCLTVVGRLERGEREVGVVVGDFAVESAWLNPSM